MSELSSLVSEYLAFRAARGFQPSRKLERLLNQFADALPPGRLDGRLFTQAQALAWAHSPAGAAPAWLAYRLSAVRQFAVYLSGSGVAGRRAGNPARSRRFPTGHPVSVHGRGRSSPDGRHGPVVHPVARGHDEDACRGVGGHRDADR